MHGVGLKKKGEDEVSALSKVFNIVLVILHCNV